MQNQMGILNLRHFDAGSSYYGTHPLLENGARDLEHAQSFPTSPPLPTRLTHFAAVPPEEPALSFSLRFICMTYRPVKVCRSAPSAETTVKRNVGEKKWKNLYLPRALSSRTHFFNLAKLAGIPAATVVPKQPEGVWILCENAKIPTWRKRKKKV